MPEPMPSLSLDERMHLGLRAGTGHMYEQDKIWSRYSNDKVDTAGMLARVIRTLSKSLSLDQALTALSIGSSNEPQFRILESACRGGLYLLDIEDAALQVVEERIRRQDTPHVQTIRGDYREVLRDAKAVEGFRETHLNGERLTLITLHHSLYYSPQSAWLDLLANIYQLLLSPIPASGPSGAIHAVLMASRSDEPASTTWLYNHFAERFFDCRNDQDLLVCAEQLRRDARLSDAQIHVRSNQIRFFVPDFEKFMAVVWMILLHPNVHRFTEEQQREVIEYVYNNLWSRNRPLVQIQDHLVIYRGQGEPGLTSAGV
jgi:hypothetical protein